MFPATVLLVISVTAAAVRYKVSALCTSQFPACTEHSCLRCCSLAATDSPNLHNYFFVMQPLDKFCADFSKLQLDTQVNDLKLSHIRVLLLTAPSIP
jgi:hypothetical protein